MGQVNAAVSNVANHTDMSPANDTRHTRQNMLDNIVLAAYATASTLLRCARES